MTPNIRVTNSAGRVLLAIALVLVWLVTYHMTGDAQGRAGQAQTPAAQTQAPAGQTQAPAAPASPPCPGQTARGVLATGVYTMKTVPEIPINGQPAPGAIWQPGMRSYWHCHGGGQVMMVFDGVGRVQKRGERMRVLHKGDTEYAAPGTEHWHGAAPDSTAQFFQVSINPPAVYWMEEVGRDDYLGNDNGIASRNEYLRTGVQAKPEAAAQGSKTPTSPATQR